MAKKEEHSNETSGLRETPTPESTQVKIRWDSSNMRSAYANVFNVAGTREEVVLTVWNEPGLGRYPEGVDGSAFRSHRPEPLCGKAAIPRAW